MEISHLIKIGLMDKYIYNDALAKENLIVEAPTSASVRLCFRVSGTSGRLRQYGDFYFFLLALNFRIMHEFILFLLSAMLVVYSIGLLYI
jgi:hypothetical protein